MNEEHDYSEYLLDLSRQDNDDRADHILKKKMISKLLNLKPFKNCEVYFFDDKVANRDAIEPLATEVVDAWECNSSKLVDEAWA